MRGELVDGWEVELGGKGCWGDGAGANDMKEGLQLGPLGQLGVSWGGFVNWGGFLSPILRARPPHFTTLTAFCRRTHYCQEVTAKCPP